MAFVLAEEIILLGKRFGVERVGFLTLTFPDQVDEMAEAQRRYNSLLTGVIRERYARGVAVPERHRNRRLHFHLVVVLATDIRTGCDFDAFERKDYKSAPPSLTAEWKFWRATSRKYGFGRHELLPVKSTSEGIGRYVGKYVGKHIGERDEADKGTRCVRFFGYGPGDRSFSAQFAWNSAGNWLWRQKTKALAQSYGMPDMFTLQQRAGPRWAWHLQKRIMATPLPGVVYPSVEAMDQAQLMEGPAVQAHMTARKLLESREFTTTYVRPHLFPGDLTRHAKVARPTTDPKNGIPCFPWNGVKEVKERMEERASTNVKFGKHLTKGRV